MNKAEFKKLKDAIVNYGNYKRELGEVLARQKFYKDDKIVSDALHNYDVHLYTQINYAWNKIENIIKCNTGQNRLPENILEDR